jgi:hypothetical protein
VVDLQHLRPDGTLADPADDEAEAAPESDDSSEETTGA